MGVLRECGGGGGLGSVSTTGCIVGDGSATPLSVQLDPSGGIACSTSGLYLTGGGGAGGGSGCAIAFSYSDTSQGAGTPTVPVEPAIYSTIQVEVKNDAMNFWYNPSGNGSNFVLDKIFVGGGSGSGGAGTVQTWYEPNGTTVAHDNNDDAYRTGQIAIGTQYASTTILGGGNGAEISTGSNDRKTKIAVYDNGAGGSAGIGNVSGIIGIHGATNAWKFWISENEGWAGRRFEVDFAAGTITLDDYDEARDDTSTDPFDNFLYTDNQGVLKAAPHYFVTEVNDGSSGASKLIDFTTRANHKLTLTANCTLSFTAPATPRSTLIRFVQDATGGRTVTFPGTTLGSVILNSGVNEQTVVNLYWDGTNWHI